MIIKEEIWFKLKHLLNISFKVQYTKLVLKDNKYPIMSKEYLLESYRLFDTDNNGWLDLHTLFSLMKTYGVTFTKEQIAEMENFLVENEIELLMPRKINEEEERVPHSKFKSRVFYYERYIAKVYSENKKQFETLMSEYKTFYDNKKLQMLKEKDTKI
jgi:hypothetical protein